MLETIAIPRRKAATVLGVGAAWLAACVGAASPAPDAAPVPDREDFARAWVRMFETKTQAEASRQLGALRATWLGRTVTWEVEIVEPFCRDGACNVRAFDFARLPEGAMTAVGGALPRVELGRADYRALTRQCLAHEGRCVARVQAQIVELPEDTDAPLRLRLAAARLLEVRAARAEERFSRVARPGALVSSRSDRPDRS